MVDAHPMARRTVLTVAMIPEQLKPFRCNALTGIYGNSCSMPNAWPLAPAGGDASVRSCYLKKNLNMDSSSNAMAYNWQPGNQMWPPNPEVRYTGGVPIMFESGTKGQPLPSKMYGCPYPPSADGKCTVSPFLQTRT